MNDDEYEIFLEDAANHVADKWNEYTGEILERLDINTLMSSIDSYFCDRRNE